MNVAQKVHKELLVFLERKANKARKVLKDDLARMENLVNLVLAVRSPSHLFVVIFTG